MLRTLKKLCLLNGVTGSEEEVRGYIKARALKYTDDVREDRMGNLMVVKRAGSQLQREDAPLPKLMLAAHMDEVGFMISQITDAGCLKFMPVGGIDPRIAFNRRVRVGEKKIPGVTGLKAVHQTPEEERLDIPKWSSMYIDIGAKNKAEAEKYVSVGDVCVFDSDFVRFGSGNGFVKAKAIDDRFGCTVMLELLKEELPMDVTFVFTVQEEVGTRGAHAAAFRLKPDIALILEGTTSADLAKVEGHKKVTSLGKGPVIGFMDAGTIYDRGLFEAIRDLADENGIPWQIKGRIAGGTDAAAVQRSLTGVKVTSISAPVRSIHTPNSVAKISDMEQGLQLARLFVKAVAEGRIK